MTRRHLFTLPAELVIEIAQYLSSPSLSALVRTCHRAYDFLNLVLYSVPVKRLFGVLAWANCVEKQRAIHHLLDHNLISVLEVKHLALRSACSAGSVEILTRLLDSAPDSPCDCGPILSRVAGVNRKQIIMMLLSAGADLDRYDFGQVGRLLGGWAPEDLEAPRALIRHGLDIHVVDSDGDNLLHRAVKQDLPVADIAFLLDEGLDINHRNGQGRTPLAAAIAIDDSALTEKPDIVELLLQRGAKTDIPDNRSWYPLHQAAFDAKPWAVRLLAQYGADLEARTSYGETPLFMACSVSSHCEKVIKALLDAGASPAAHVTGRRGEKRTPLHLALAKRDPISRAVRVRYLFDAWMAMSPALPSADVVFVAAAALGEVAVLQKLIDSKTVNIEGADGGTTALMAAAGAGQDNVIELLLPLGANVDAVDELDCTALQYAVCSGTETTIQLLLP
jgi:ankyrin repeat protein